MPFRVVILDDSLGVDAYPTLPSNVYVVQPPVRLGQQRLLTNFFRSQFFIDLSPSPEDVVVVMDADGEDDPQDVPALIDVLLNKRCDVVLAERTSRISSSSFKVGYFFFKLMTRVVAGQTIKTGTFSASRWRWLSNSIKEGVYSSSFAGGLIASNANRQTIPLSRAKRRYGTSHQKTGSLIFHGLNIFSTFSNKISIRFFSFSVILTFLVLLSSMVVIALKFLDIAVPGYTSIVLILLVQLNVLSVILFLSALQVSKLTGFSSASFEFEKRVVRN